MTFDPTRVYLNIQTWHSRTDTDLGVTYNKEHHHSGSSNALPPRVRITIEPNAIWNADLLLYHRSLYISTRNPTTFSIPLPLAMRPASFFCSFIYFHVSRLCLHKIIYIATALPRRSGVHVCFFCRFGFRFNTEKGFDRIQHPGLINIIVFVWPQPKVFSANQKPKKKQTLPLQDCRAASAAFVILVHGFRVSGTFDPRFN